MVKTKVIIAGSRDFYDYDLLAEECNIILEGKDDIEVVSGRAIGADMLGEMYAKDKKYPVKLFPADWNTHGKGAGFIRNGEMAKYANMLIAFWDGESKGTKHMVETAQKKGMEVYVIDIYKNLID